MSTPSADAAKDPPIEGPGDFRVLFEAAWRAGAIRPAEPWRYLCSVGP